MIRTILKAPFLVCFILCLPVFVPIYLVIAIGDWAFERGKTLKESLRWGIE